MITNMELIEETNLKRKYFRSIKKYKRKREIKIKPGKKVSKFKFIILIVLFILILFFVLFFILKTIYKKLNLYPKDDLTIVSAYLKLKRAKYHPINYLHWISNLAKLLNLWYSFQINNLCHFLKKCDQKVYIIKQYLLK